MDLANPGCKGSRQSKELHMPEEGNESVETEVSEVPLAAETETTQDERQEPEQKAERRKRNDAEYSWAEVRRQIKDKDQQIDELRKQLSQNQPKAAPEEDEIGRLAEDDIITVAQAKKLAAKMAKQTAQEVLRQREAATIEDRLKLHYPDYAEVLSNENIELLKQNEPELAMSISHIPDPYNQAVAAYKLLKKVAPKKGDSNALEKKKAMENSQKPISVQAVTKQSAIGNAHVFENGLTKELKDQYWKEMQQAMKG